jgi:NTE family protein
MRFHMIDSSDLPILQRTETKLLAHAPFLELLRGQGHERGQAWLFDHAPSVGHRSTISMKKLFA